MLNSVGCFVVTVTGEMSLALVGKAQGWWISHLVNCPAPNASNACTETDYFSGSVRPLPPRRAELCVHVYSILTV